MDNLSAFLSLLMRNLTDCDFNFNVMEIDAWNKAEIKEKDNFFGYWMAVKWEVIELVM